MEIGIIIALVTIIICLIVCTGLKHKIKYKNIEVEKINSELNEKNKELQKQHKEYTEECEELQDKLDTLNRDTNAKNNDYSLLLQKIESCQEQVSSLCQQEEQTKERIKTLSKDAEDIANSQTQLIAKAFDNYCDNLETQYTLKEKEYAELVELLEKAYADKQNKLHKDTEDLQQECENKKAQMMADVNKTVEDLEKIRSTRAAAIEALRREKEILADNSYYCIQISDEDKADIQRLDNIKKTLNKPRVLSMLIWSTWFQKPLKQLASNILGPNVVSGIYKITNTITGEVYIGQAVDVAKRWAEHAKAGLGIDTPAGNKLYAAMLEYGLCSFSWELLEQCPADLLNAKERFYIELYQSVNFGYNILKGNKD